MMGGNANFRLVGDGATLYNAGERDLPFSNVGDGVYLWNARGWSDLPPYGQRLGGLLALQGDYVTFIKAGGNFLENARGDDATFGSLRWSSYDFRDRSAKLKSQSFFA